MVRGSWFVVRGSWFVVRGSWLVVRGSWFVARGSWLVVRGSWLVVRGSWLVVRRGRPKGGPPLYQERLSLMLISVTAKKGLSHNGKPFSVGARHVRAPTIDS